MDKSYLKLWIISGIILFLVLVIAVRLSIAFFNFFFWFLAASFALSFVSCAYFRYTSRLSLKRRFPSKVDEGDILEIETEVENTGFFPVFNLVLEDTAGCAEEDARVQRAVIDYLPPKYAITLRHRCVCRKRGLYEIGPCAIFFFDFFGFMFLKKKMPVSDRVFVYPRIFDIARFPRLIKGSLPWFGIGATQSSGDDDDFFGIREYKPGDPVKSIHWISTARKHKFIVKEFQRQNFYRATVLFNLAEGSDAGEGNRTIAEYIIKITASVVKHLLDMNVSVELIAHTGEMIHIPSNRGKEHFEDILKVLTVARPESNVSMTEIFEEFTRFIPEDSNLIVVMQDTDWDAFLSTAAAARLNSGIIPVIILASSFLSGGSEEVRAEAMIKLVQKLDYAPILVSAGDELERVFS